MRGDLVIIRVFGGKPEIRRVWDENEKVVYITNDVNLSLLLAGKSALEPIGFPKEDVFKYDEVLAESMESLYCDGKWDWNNLVRWAEN